MISDFLIGGLSLFSLTAGATIPPKNSSTNVTSTFNETVATNSSIQIPQFYSALVTIGDSYSDDGHPREARYDSSYGQGRPYSDFGGKYTNGRVEVEYMVLANQTTTLSDPNNPKDIQTINLAYSGAEISNSITPPPYPTRPDSGEQINLYLDGIGNGDIAVAGNQTDRVLHFIQIGINPIQQIWANAVNSHPNATNNSTVMTQAYSLVNASMEALKSQLRTLNTGVQGRIAYPDYMLIGTPSLQNNLYNRQLFGGQNLTFLQNMQESYNSQLTDFVDVFRIEVSPSSRVFFYDLPALFSDFFANPTKYDIDPASLNFACYLTDGSVCADFKHALFFDTEHINTQIHALWADLYNAVVMKR